MMDSNMAQLETVKNLFSREPQKSVNDRNPISIDFNRSRWSISKEATLQKEFSPITKYSISLTEWVSIKISVSLHELSGILIVVSFSPNSISLNKRPGDKLEFEFTTIRLAKIGATSRMEREPTSATFDKLLLQQRKANHFTRPRIFVLDSDLFKIWNIYHRERSGETD